MEIKIITDSASDITQKEAQELGIKVLPLQVSFGSEDYLDGITLSHYEFYEKLIESDVIPKTSQISSYTFEEAFREAVEEGAEVLCITLSSKLSGTYNSACSAAAEVGGKITVIDSESVAVGERLLILRTLEMIKEGMPSEEIAGKLKYERRQLRVMALLNTLEYLKKGGRISSAVALIGGALSIKPVVEIRNGEVQFLGTARGSRAGNNRLNEKIKASGGVDFSRPVYLTYSGLNDSLLQKYISDSASLYPGKVDELPTCCVGCTIGTYAGPGAIGIAFFAKEDGSSITN